MGLKDYFKISKFSPKTYWKEILAVFIILLAFVFFRSERHEMRQIIPQLRQANLMWILAGVGITLIYITLQALMYVQSFRAVHLQLKLPEAITLFLKRNFLSVFLPAGGISSLSYLPTELKRKKYYTATIAQASGIYAFVGLLTVFLVGIPVIIYISLTKQDIANLWTALAILGIFLIIIFLLFKNLKDKGSVYRILEKKLPHFTTRFESIFVKNLNQNAFYQVIIYSILIEFTGILHVFIAILALGATPTFTVAAIAYTISVLLMIISPFLRGLGAVEFSMLYIFTAFGYSNTSALGITLLYRTFEFWFPLVSGIFAFLYNGRKLFARVFPVIAIFCLGVINIISVITPPLAARLAEVKHYLPFEARHISNLATLALGIGLLVISAQLVKGLKSAWYLAVIFSLLSIFGNVFKAFDYEEASFALLTFLLLYFTRKQYVIKNNRRFLGLGIRAFFIILSAILLFDFFSFYFIDEKHFGVNFSWSQSIYYTFQSFLFFYTDSPLPNTAFGREFISITKFLGALSWILLIFTLLIPFNFNFKKENSERHRAQNLVEKYGRSALDYFKISLDKSFFFSETHEGFVSFKIAKNFAVILEEPVCALTYKRDLILEFEKFCRKKGLKTFYYRATEEMLPTYLSLKKQKLLIGQEAVVEIDSFSLQGKDKKSLRNGINGLTKKGFEIQTYQPPHQEEFLTEIKNISDEWLQEFDKKESVFSQGSFSESELSTQTIIVVKDETGFLQAFLNIIPDYAPNELTYDLIRKRKEAPGGCLDALIVALIEYGKTQNFKFLNMGLTPMSGITTPDNTVEQILKYAYHKVGSLKHYQSLRFFKEKYASIWQNKYLIYSDDFDLLKIPAALNKVMKEDEI